MNFLLSDGIEIPHQLIGSDKLDWKTGYPKTDDISRSCIAWSGQGGSIKIMNTKCDATDDLTGSGPKPYYDKESGDAFDDTLLLRGYLCEARAIHTITAYDREVKSLPFFI